MRCALSGKILPERLRKSRLHSYTSVERGSEFMASVEGIRDVAERHLCTGCGACAYVQPDVIRMVDDLDQGRRPLTADGADTGPALAVCPGYSLTAPPDPPGIIARLRPGWGPVLSLWEGYATDKEIRYLGSSGGAATALALFGLEVGGLHGVLHIDGREDVPYLNRSRLSRTREELVAATGSRYAPASPCDGLAQVAEAPGPCLMIGKPCDVAGAFQVAQQDAALRERLALTVAIFCAGTPSTRGTLELARSVGLEDPSQISGLRYRGKGWPGQAEVRAQGGRVERMSYADSWGFLQRYRQWRCYVCADHTGEFADISVGDPWYRPIPADEPGRSLILARTARGAAFLERATAAGALELERVPPSILVESQRNLLQTRGAVWGRALVLRALGVPVPRYRGLPTFRIWARHLTVKMKLQSIYGTVKRVFKKRLRDRAIVRPWGDDRA